MSPRILRSWQFLELFSSWVFVFSAKIPYESSIGFPIDYSLWISDGFPYDFFKIHYWFSINFAWVSYGFPMTSYGLNLDWLQLNWRWLAISDCFRNQYVTSFLMNCLLFNEVATTTSCSRRLNLIFLRCLVNSESFLSSFMSKLERKQTHQTLWI